jgi:hypothetical protein
MFDGVSSTLTARPSVVVADGVIAAVHGRAGPLPAGARVVDLPWLTLLPGLVDAHLHLCFDATGDPAGHLASTGDDLPPAPWRMSRSSAPPRRGHRGRGNPTTGCPSRRTRTAPGRSPTRSPPASKGSNTRRS